MRAFHLRAALLARRRGSSVPLSSRPALRSRSLAPLQLPLAPAAADAWRSFSFSAAFPTSAEAALLAHADEEHDPNRSQLVCGSCSSPISQTSDLVFFKWKNGIHLSSTTDAPLQHLKPHESWEEERHWKKHKLLCLKCGHHIGTMAKVFTSDKILFSAKQVAIQMPAHQSPLISISGYPSSQLGFTYWTELILMLESQPSLKDALQIRRIDHFREMSDERKQLNRTLLMAKDLRALLRVVAQHSSEMNAINISIALDRASRFVVSQSTAKVAPKPRMTVSSKSEAPEDQLLDIAAHIMERPRSPEEIASEKKQFWDLIQMAENLVNFSIASLNTGYELVRFLSATTRLGVGRKSILEPVAKQAVFLSANVSEDKPTLNVLEASIISTSVTHLASKEVRGEPWVKELLRSSGDLVLQELERGVACDLNTLVPLARAFVMADEFHDELFRLLFDEVARKKRLEHLPALSPYKLRNLKSKMYQIHLDCELSSRATEFRLTPAQVEEFKEIFQHQEVQLKSASFRMQHLVSTALMEMGVLLHDRAFALDDGYVVDVSMHKFKVAIEINDASSYQVVEGGDDNSGDGSVVDKPLGFVDIKARHLEKLGWVVIQLRADKFQKLAGVEERVRYLSMLLEVANNAAPGGGSRFGHE